MKTIKQTANYPLTMNRFDNGQCVTFEPNVEVEVDDATAEFLLNANQFYIPVDENGVDMEPVLAAQFVLSGS